MHLGKDTSNCSNLQVNNKPMMTTSSEKYLGDILTCDAKMEENIKMRHDKGMAAINQIMSILQEISFGRYHFEIGMVMRTSMLINGILYNTEALTSISSRHTDMLEECDKVFMRRLFSAEQGTPIESFFLETSAWPLRFIIMGRKLMYYWTMLRKSDSELAKSVFNAQLKFPSKVEWISDTKDILNYCNIELSAEDIKKMSQQKFKLIVKEKLQFKVMAYLIAMQNKHSKSEHLSYEGNMKEYLTDANLSVSEKKFLFKLRSKMLRIKSNFSSAYKNDLSCSLCLDKQSIEDENHLVACPL